MAALCRFIPVLSALCKSVGAALHQRLRDRNRVACGYASVGDVSTGQLEVRVGAAACVPACLLLVCPPAHLPTMPSYLTTNPQPRRMRPSQISSSH